MMDLAERLYGERGLDAVSLREISSGAGSGNNTAVQYHFGDATGLIRAILDRRMPAVDEARSVLFGDMTSNGQALEVRALMNTLFMPLINHVDQHGERAHARFVLALLNSSKAHLWGNMFQDLQPFAFKTLDCLVEATGVPQPLLIERQRLVAIMVLTSVFNRLPQLSSDLWDAALIDNALAMASAAITAPVEGDAIRNLPS
jgi:AcrR family transcriptional regulator